MVAADHTKLIQKLHEDLEKSEYKIAEQRDMLSQVTAHAKVQAATINRKELDIRKAEAETERVLRLFEDRGDELEAALFQLEKERVEHLAAERVDPAKAQQEIIELKAKLYDLITK